ncbi:hypothetical protein CSC80_14390 [Maribacter sp. 6B07]|nr:hypothetical protein CSC80_14390 [Maribacter sp. 6B07]
MLVVGCWLLVVGCWKFSFAKFHRTKSLYSNFYFLNSYLTHCKIKLLNTSYFVLLTLHLSVSSIEFRGTRN